MNKLEGNTLRHGFNEFVEKFPLIYAVDWCVWPPTQAINFWVLPSRFRVMYVYLVDFVWYTFNSYVKHKVKLSFSFDFIYLKYSIFTFQKSYELPGISKKELPEIDETGNFR